MGKEIFSLREAFAELDKLYESDKYIDPKFYELSYDYAREHIKYSIREFLETYDLANGYPQNAIKENISSYFYWKNDQELADYILEFFFDDDKDEYRDYEESEGITTIDIAKEIIEAHKEVLYDDDFWDDEVVEFLYEDTGEGFPKNSQIQAFIKAVEKACISDYEQGIKNIEAALDSDIKRTIE